jgi:hypothetical protein
VPAAPNPTAQGIQTIIDHLAKTRPQAKGLKPNDFIDASILKEIDESGFIKKLYANQIVTAVSHSNCALVRQRAAALPKSTQLL